MPASSRKAKHESPDPLLLTDADEIVVHRNPLTPVKKKPRLSRAPDASPSVRSKAQTSSAPGKATTPARKSAQTRSGTPAVNGHVSVTPTKTAGNAQSPAKSASKGAPTIPSGKKQLSTPRRSTVKANGRTSPLPKSVSRVVDPGSVLELDSPVKSSAISRDAFLANEALKRQREARNFKYKGDANAPRLTRSGKVVGDVVQDEYDEFDRDETTEPLDDNPFLIQKDVESNILAVDEEALIPRGIEKPPTAPVMAPRPALEPLPDFARHRISGILSSITSTHVAENPPPFADELANESLSGITKLLQGTVDRGEGNSALVTGPRGSGKTRVSLLHCANMVVSGTEPPDDGESPQSFGVEFEQHTYRRQALRARANKR